MDIRNIWAHLSIRSKALVWLGTVLFVTLTMTAISSSMRNRITQELAWLQDNVHRRRPRV